jgi:hypothetical protein
MTDDLECSNCDCRCAVTKYCDGCETMLCEGCWRDHNYDDDCHVKEREV